MFDQFVDKKYFEETLQAMLLNINDRSALNDNLKALEKQYAELEADMMLKMRESGLNAFETEENIVKIRKEEYPSVLEANRPLLFEWLQEQGAGHLVKTTTKVDDRSLRTFLRDDFNGERPCFINVFEKEKLEIKKAKLRKTQL